MTQRFHPKISPKDFTQRFHPNKKLRLHFHTQGLLLMTLANVVTGITTISMSVLKHFLENVTLSPLALTLNPSPNTSIPPHLTHPITHSPFFPSRSAICTNGQISSGGVYYMISRCCWILTNSVAGAMTLFNIEISGRLDPSLEEPLD